MIINEKWIVKEYRLSLNALGESYAHNAIRIKRSYQEKNMIILINNGSTRNVIDIKLVKEIKVTYLKTIILVVIMENKSMVRCDSNCLKLTWFMQN